MKYLSKSEENTRVFARKLATLINPGDVILSRGNLGAGKTLIAQELGKCLGVEHKINSPTFNIVKSYSYPRGSFNHIDAYRLEDSPNTNIGLDELIFSSDVTYIEWPMFIEKYLPSKALIIDIEYCDEGRLISLTGTKEYQTLIKTMEEAFNE